MAIMEPLRENEVLTVQPEGTGTPTERLQPRSPAKGRIPKSALKKGCKGNPGALFKSLVNTNVDLLADFEYVIAHPNDNYRADPLRLEIRRALTKDIITFTKTYNELLANKRIKESPEQSHSQPLQSERNGHSQPATTNSANGHTQSVPTEHIQASQVHQVWQPLPTAIGPTETEVKIEEAIEELIAQLESEKQ